MYYIFVFYIGVDYKLYVLINKIVYLYKYIYLYIYIYRNIYLGAKNIPQTALLSCVLHKYFKRVVHACIRLYVFFASTSTHRVKRKIRFAQIMGQVYCTE
jgi:hypothetical protein